MKDFRILIFLDRFKGFFTRLGIDYVVMRKILQVKLIMDERRVPTIISNSSRRRRSNSGKDQNNFIRSLWFYVLMGLIMVPIVLMKNNYLYQMSIVFGLLMFMIMTTLISDFSSVLLDIRDRNIIFSKRVNGRTLSMAKTIHVFIYMFYITLSLSGPALVGALYGHGIAFFLVFLAEIILMDLFIVVLTALLYLLILKFYDGEKLKDIINYVQIALSIAIAVGYQLIGRLFDIMNINIVFHPKWWQYFVIPVWFGGPFEVILHGNHNGYFLGFSTLALVVPVAAIAVYIKLTPSFEKNLQKLNNNSTRAEKGNNRFYDKLSRVICSSKTERTFFRFASDMMRNERSFKLKVYPSLGLAMVFPFIFIFNQLRTVGFANIASSRAYLNIYFCAVMLPTTVMMIRYSSNAKGSWIYRALPIRDVSPVFKGTLKACISRLLFPVFFVESIIFIVIFGFRIFPDLIAVFLAMMFFTILCFRALKKVLPFSETYEAAQQSEGIAVLPLMAVLGVLAGIHYASTRLGYGIYIFILVMLVLNIIAWKTAFKISWEKLSN